MTLGRRLRPILAAILAGLVASALPAAPAQAAPATHQKTAIPAYWGPDTPAGREMFQRLAQNVPTSEIVVVNGSMSKPETPFNGAWADAIKKIHDIGAMPIGYVDTGYYGVAFDPFPAHSTRPDGPGGGAATTAAWTAQIRQDIDDWFELYGAYGLEGIFLDQTIQPCGTAGDPDAYVDLYSGISDYISDNHPGTYLIINPGVPVDQCYEDIADTIVTFEGTYATYLNDTYPTKQWQLDSDNPGKFWHLIYDVPTQADMETVVTRSKNQNAGYVYVTDDKIVTDSGGNVTGFPWDTIPPYWHAELVKAAGVTDTTAPDPPDGLAGTGVSGTATARVNLTWNNPYDNVATADYEVFRDGVSLGHTYDNGMTVTGLAPSASYQFKVRARDAAGNVGDFSADLPVTTPAPAAAPILNASGCLTAATLRFQGTYVDPFTDHRVFINTDNDPATGYGLPPGQPAGIDYMIENRWLYRYVGPGWNWSLVSGVSPLVSSADDVYVWQVPVSALTGAATTQVAVLQGTASGVPDAYSTTLTVSQTANC